jgi:hypothetical protein
MVKAQTKRQQTKTNSLISPNQTSKLDSKLSKKPGKKEYKSRQQIYQENYQKNKDRKKAQQKINYAKKKEQTELATQQAWGKHYGAEAIRILMSLKQYTELNQQKMKLWADFNWTLKDCYKAVKEGINDITPIMKLEQVASNLVRDYWKTAKSEERKGKNWNSLTEEQQTKLIRYWGYEKARVENGYLDTAEKLEKQSQEYKKDIELAKFHEERGKVKCECYSCEQKKEIQQEVKKKINQELKELDQQEQNNGKGKCCMCGKIRELDEEGACKNCSESLE